MAQLDPTLFERTTDGVVLPSKLEPVVWTIPAKEAKNGLAHEVPLSGAVIELLRDLATRDEGAHRCNGFASGAASRRLLSSISIQTPALESSLVRDLNDLDGNGVWVRSEVRVCG